MATVMLRFDPTDSDSTPPRLGSLTTKLKVLTFFASSARATFPSKCATSTDLTQGMHTEQLALSQRCVANVEWTKHDPSIPSTMTRRDSACSTDSPDETPAPSATYKNKKFYTARILAPVTLPTNKSFVPTFHSCLVSRSYYLKFELAAGFAGSMDLKVPIRVACAPRDGNMSPARRPSTVDSSLEEDIGAVESAAEFFQPRIIRAPQEQHVGESTIGGPMDAPPGYFDFVGFAGPPPGMTRTVPVF